MTKPLTVECPGCKTRVIWSTDNPNRPFCSERCKNHDFIAWADEQHSIPGSTDYEDSLSDLLRELHD